MKKVLVVDDNPKINLITEKLINIVDPNLEVVKATSGEEGLRLASELHPNIILLDILMPEIDGYKICEELKNKTDTEDIPVVLVSSLEFDNENRLKAINAGADGFVTKPLNKQELTLQLRAMLKINEGNLRRKSEQQRLKKLVDEQTSELRTELALRKQTEEKLQEHEKYLEDLNATKDKFFSIIAHDLKSPFGNIVGLSEIILKKVEQKKYEDVERLIRMLQKVSNHSYNLLINLLEWSRTQFGSQTFHPDTHNLFNVVKEVSEIFSVIAEEKRVKIDIECPGNILVYADLNMLKTILRNLISNALKYSYPGNKIVISASKEKNEVTVAVQDFGVGMTPENLQQLFKVGEEISLPGTKNEKGTGIGLILCREFVERHKGKIWVESQPGEGSVFYFTLPFPEPQL